MKEYFVSQIVWNYELDSIETGVIFRIIIAETMTEALECFPKIAEGELSEFSHRAEIDVMLLGDIERFYKP